MASSPERPNLILIMTDQQRWETVGAYGALDIETPTLDRLAAEGVLFDRAFVPVPLCTPSRASVFTGQYPSRHGVRTNLQPSLPGSAPNFLLGLREAGYRTLLAGKDHLFGPAVARWFDEVAGYSHAGAVPPAPPAEREVSAIRRAGLRVPFTEVDETPLRLHPTVRVTDAAIAMTEAADEPYFLWLSYPDPHPPFMVPEPYASRYRDRLDWPVVVDAESDGKPLRQRLARTLMERGGITTDRVRRLREIYAGMVTLIDHQLDRLVTALIARGAAENTVLVFMSDHGDYLGDHSMVRKSPAMYDCLIRIPFLVWAPGRFQARRERSAFVESIDIAPTLLDLAGVPTRYGMEGTSLTRLLNGVTDRHKDAVFGIYGLEGPAATSEKEAAAISARTAGHGNDPWNGAGVMQGRFAMVRTPGHKLVHYRGGEGELYDLAGDPGETINLWSDIRFRDVRRPLEARLLDWALETFTVSPPPHS